MNTRVNSENADILNKELEWFSKVLDARTKIYFEQKSDIKSIYEIEAPVYSDTNAAYAQLIEELNLDFDERLIIVLALIPHIKPHILDTFFINNVNLNRPFTEFGGWKGSKHNGFLPTGETAAFIIAGGNLSKRFELLTLFENSSIFYQHKIVEINNHSENEPFLSGELIISTEYLNKLTTGIYHKPDYNVNFPAKHISTKLNWEDLVLGKDVIDAINDINAWIKYSEIIMNEWGLEKVLKPGYRSLFYGPPGTGKTLTASLIGKNAELDVYRIDLSMVVSKYIGETEKNLKNVFDQAENKKWILFFDEADALFGKRTQTSSSNDRYANQEVSYLLQRIEDFPGVIILATNLKQNVDDAFARRFQSIIHFPMPEVNQRLLLWQKIFLSKNKIASDVNLEKIAEKFELSGGAILNVVRYCVLKILQYNLHEITEQILINGICKELIKEGKTI